MKRELILALVYSVLISITGIFAEPLSLDCETSKALALKNNSDLMQEAISLGTERRNADSSWNNFLPDVAVSLGLSEKLNIASGGVQEQTSLNPGLSVSYTLMPGLRETVRKLKLSLESAEIGYDSAVVLLKENVESEFYYLLTTKNNIEIQKKNIELAHRQTEQTEAKFNNGLVSELEVMQAKVNEANLVPSYTKLVSSYKNQLKEFLLIIGVDPMTEVELTGSLEVEPRSFDADALISEYLGNRSDIKTQQKQIEILNSTYKQTRANGRLPKVTLSASVSDSISSPFSSEGWQDYSPSAGISLSMSASLGLDDYIPGSSTDVGIKKIEDSISRAELQLETLMQSAKLEIINIVDSLESAKANLEVSKLNLALSESSFRMTQQSFERGKTDSLTLQNAQQDLLTAKQNLLESRYEYLNGLISLRSALGLESLDSVKQE